MMDEALHKSRTAWTCDMLRDAIIRAEYAPGEKLRIDQIGKTLEASSGAVREALSRLTAEGLVVAEPQKGFVVAPISRRDLEDLTDVRVEIETRCLIASFLAGDIEWEGRLISVQHRLRSLKVALTPVDTPEARRWHMLHAEFHAALVSACPNAWWLRLRQQLYLQSERYRRLSGPFGETGRDIAAEHDAIAEAALARDIPRASAAMADHLQRTTAILLGSRIPFADGTDTSLGG